jgi:hypothetical protein
MEELGACDAKKGDFFEVLEAWEMRLWETLAEVRSHGSVWFLLTMWL